MLTKNYLKSLLLLLCMIVGAGTAWAETSTLTFTAQCNGSGTADDGVQWSVTSDGDESTFDNTKGIHYGTGSANVQYIKLTTSEISGTITKIVVNASAAKGVSATASVTVGGAAFGGAAQSISTTATDYTFEGSASGKIVVTVTKPSSATKAIYVKSIVVTYSTASASPLASIALLGTYPTNFYVGDAFSHEGMTVTATYEDESNKDVTGKAVFSGYDMSNAGNHTVTVSYTENKVTKTAEYNITVSERPKYTVTFSDGGSVTQASYGAEVTLPSREGIGDYTFAGWSETNVDVETTTAPTIIPAGSYTPATNITLYPVYTRTEGGGGTPTAFSIGDTGDFVIVSEAQSENYYALPTKPTLNSGKITAQQITVSETNGIKYVTPENASGFTWTITAATNGYTLSDGTNYIYHSNGGGSGTNLAYDSGTTYTWSFTKDGDYIKMAGMSGATTNNRGLLFNGTTIGGYSLSNWGTSGYYKTMILPIFIGGTTYYWSSPIAAAVERPVITFVENPFLFSTTATITCATEGAVIYYSYDNKNWNEYTAALNITETTTIYAKATKGNDESNIATATVTKNLAEPTVTISGNLTVDLNGETNVEAGTLTAAVTYNEAAVDGATVTWSGNNDAVATINATTGEVTILARGEVTFTATYAGNSDYAEATATKTITVIDSKAPGTEGRPYTVAEAIDAIDNSGDVTGVYATGIVSEIVTAYSSTYGNITYNISADGTIEAAQLQAFRGKSYDGENFTSEDDIQVGDVVVIYGDLTKYDDTTYEFKQNNQLVSLIRKADPGLSYETTAFETFPGDEDFVAPALTNPHELTVAYASSDEDVALVDANTGEILLGDVEGTATVTASFAGNETYKAGNASYTITLTKLENGLAFDQTEFETRVGKDFDAPTLNNPNGLTVTYTSSDEDVAMVDEKTGEVLVGDAGETTITATFAGSTKFKAGSASYTLTVIAGKMDADLAWKDATLSINAGLEKDVNELYTVTSNGEVSFVSSDATVAEIVNGKLLAKKPGEATITVNVAEATDYAQASADMVVTVTVFADMPAFDPTAAGGYVKVTATEDIVSGDYLIVNEDAGVAFNGGLETLDAANNVISVEITDGTIAETDKAKAAVFTINVTDGTLQDASGNYIGKTANSNGLDVKTTVLTNTFAIEDGSAVITASGGCTLRYNKASDQNRFRYYKSGQQAIQLYRHQSAGVTIGSTGWRTLVASANVQFPTEVTAYIVTSEDNEKAKLKAVNAVKAGVPVLLKAEPGNYILTVAADGDCADTSKNLLEVSEQNTCENVYVLANKSNGVGFYKWTGGWMGAGRVYLPVSPEVGARGFLAFDEDGETTGISTIQNAKQGTKGIYNLNGQRVNQPAKGLYIVNGKKVFIK